MSLGLEWEAILEGKQPWVIIYGVPLPEGFSTAKADVAIMITPGYPTAALDMAFFNPPIRRTDGRAIERTDGVHTLDGNSWQQWSRHRTGGNPWLPGVDNLERHFAYMLDWFERELTR